MITLQQTLESANAIQARPGSHLLRAEVIEPADDRWLTFISSQSDSQIFHHPCWMELLGRTYNYRQFVVTESDGVGRILAGLPLMEVNSPLTGRRWVSLPFTDYCRPLFDREQTLERLTRDLLSLSIQERIPRVELRWGLPNNTAIHPACSYILNILDLDSDPEKVAKHFDRSNRQNTRAAEKNQVEVRWGKDLADMRKFYELQVVTRRRHGVPVQPWRYFRLMAESLLGRGMCSILLAFKDDRCLAGLVLLHWQQTTVCKYAASREDSLPLRPNNLLFWSAIRWSCEHGFKVFDMGRTETEDAGLRRFKKGWGAREIPLIYYSIDNKSRRRSTVGGIAPLMHTIIRRSPPWVCQLSGQILYKHFG